VAWHHLFFIHHQTTDRRGIAPFLKALWCQYQNSNNNSNNNNHDNVYGAAIVASHCESSPIIWWMQEYKMAAKWLGLWVHEQAAGIHIHHCHLLLLLSLKDDTHFTVPQEVESWVDLCTAVRACSPYPRLYKQLSAMRFKPGSSHTAVSHVSTRPSSTTGWLAVMQQQL